jgi:transposase
MRTNKEFQKIVVQMREKGFYKAREPLSVDWSAYTANQISDIIETLKFIREEVDKVQVPTQENVVGRPPVNPSELAKAILFVETFCIPERKAEGWIFLMAPHLGITKKIDDRVIGKAYQNPAVIFILETVFGNNKSNDRKMSGDGSNLEGSRKDNYESKKKKDNYLVSIVDSREVVQAFNVGEKGECPVMHGLVEKIKKELEKDVGKFLGKAKLTLDAGFVDRKLVQLIEDGGITPYIFPKKNNAIASRGYPAWGRMVKQIIENVMNWLEEYHIRSHAESFHSSFKRIFGIITKRLTITVYTQVLCRVIHNNRRKTNYHKLKQLGITVN